MHACVNSRANSRSSTHWLLDVREDDDWVVVDYRNIVYPFPIYGLTKIVLVASRLTQALHILRRAQEHPK